MTHGAVEGQTPGGGRGRIAAVSWRARIRPARRTPPDLTGSRCNSGTAQFSASTRHVGSGGENREELHGTGYGPSLFGSCPGR